ncbi:MAG: hypothetical protein AAB385_10400 [Planctomycetota bacterium]
MKTSVLLTACLFGLAAKEVAAKGPDIIVGNITEVTRWSHVGDITAFSIGSTACNIGDTPVQWQGNTNRHPVISQNLYRYRDGRFEQIGQSWMKHGFAADTQNACAICQVPGSAFLLGIGCSDTYRSQLNGSQSSMRPRSSINPVTGLFQHPSSAPPLNGDLDRRMQVRDSDLDPDLNVDAFYFLEVIYIAPDDAETGNANNNASYRQCLVSESPPGAFTLTIALGLITQQQKNAIEAWLEYDPTVTLSLVDLPLGGRISIGATATHLNNGFWRYEYAVANHNSDRAIGRISITSPPDAVITNVGFHDVDSHSGEPYSNTDWPNEHTHGLLAWQTTRYQVNQYANPIRWGTLYNFRFDANAPPVNDCPLSLGLFIPGDPAAISIPFLGPSSMSPDCNANVIPDAKELARSPLLDCNGNGILDNCETTICPGIIGGDLNCDGGVTLDDVMPFVQAMLTGGPSCQSDMNKDQYTDAQDIVAFIAAVMASQ